MPHRVRIGHLKVKTPRRNPLFKNKREGFNGHQAIKKGKVPENFLLLEAKQT